MNNNSTEILCSECKSILASDAIRCANCGQPKHKWKRFILNWGGVTSAVLVTIPLWQLMISASDFWNFRLDYAINISCDPGFIEFEFFNRERSRPLVLQVDEIKVVTWQEDYLELIGDRNKIFSPNQIGILKIDVPVKEEPATENSHYILKYSISEFPYSSSTITIALENEECSWQSADTL